MNKKIETHIYQASNGVKVTFRYQPAKYDFKHTIFIFSGFGRDRPDHYNFTNILNYCPAHIIWINDNFEDFFTYYMCINMNFKVADAVEEFIRNKVNELKLKWEDITLLGGSKGGSAAIYHGLRMNIHNIVAYVPQIKIGSFLDDERPFTAKTANHMMGENYTNYQIHKLDNIIVELLKKDNFLNRNIYLLTSEYDDQYSKYLAQYLNDFKKYQNFNLIKTYSAFVRHHGQITEHHLILILGILYSLCSEAVPHFLQPVNFFGSQPIYNTPPSYKPHIELQQLEYKNNKLFIQGIGILRGVPCPTYNDIYYSMIFESENGDNIEKELAKTHNPDLSKKLFDGDLINYDKGTFTTIKYAGLDIFDIPKGKYRIYLKIHTAPKTTIVKITSHHDFSHSAENIIISEQQNDYYIEIL